MEPNQEMKIKEAAGNKSSLPSLRAFAPTRETPVFNVEEISAIVVDCGDKLHIEAGIGLLKRGLGVRRQVPVPIELVCLKFDEEFRANILVEKRFLIELKSVERLLPVHSKQVLTYLRLLDLPLGLLINYDSPTFKEGVHRIANHHKDFASSRLRMNQPSTPVILP